MSHQSLLACAPCNADTCQWTGRRVINLLGNHRRRTLKSTLSCSVFTHWVVTCREDFMLLNHAILHVGGLEWSTLRS